MRKNVFVLNVDNYRPDLCRYTLPTIRAWAQKINADYREITSRVYPSWPVTYEKMQVHRLGKGAHWNILVDADFMLRPDLPDFTQMIHPEIVGVHYSFPANAFFENDVYFERDRRNFGIAGGFVMSSSLTHDLWTPLDEAPDGQLHIDYVNYWLSKTRRHFIIDEYCISRNLAKFGLKYTGVEFNPEIAKAMIHIGSEERSAETRARDVIKAKKLFDEWGFKENG